MLKRKDTAVGDNVIEPVTAPAAPSSSPKAATPSALDTLADDELDTLGVAEDTKRTESALKPYLDDNEDDDDVAGDTLDDEVHTQHTSHSFCYSLYHSILCIYNRLVVRVDSRA